MSRARIPRRVKHAQQPGRTAARLRHWKLVRRYYLRLSAAVKRVEVQGYLARLWAMPLLYRLDGHTPVADQDPLAWAAWIERPDRPEQQRVGLDQVGPYQVSTVFIGHNLQWHPDAPPLVFETMVFTADGAPAHEQPTQRYSTWEEAAQGHADLVAQLQRELS
jgi:hypothetical protein